jgi:leucyl-tRNA synthetase
VKEETTVMVVQINGKVRARLDVAPDISEADASAAALSHATISQAIAGKSPQRVVVRPPRLVNIII